MAKRKRRAFTKAFKAEAVRVVRESGKSVAAAAREMDLTEATLRDWVRQAANRCGLEAAGGAEDGRADGVGPAPTRGADVAHGTGEVLHNIVPSGSLGNVADIEATIRAKVAEGRLPLKHSTATWAAFGSGGLCDACDRPILATEVEHELDVEGEGGGVRTWYVHAACEAIWRRLTNLR